MRKFWESSLIMLLAIARIFQDSNRRRLPVLREGKLVGQMSARKIWAISGSDRTSSAS